MSEQYNDTVLGTAGSGDDAYSSELQRIATRKALEFAAKNVPLAERGYPKPGELWRAGSHFFGTCPDHIEHEWNRTYGLPKIHMVEEVGVTVVWLQDREGQRVVRPINEVRDGWQRVTMSPGEDWRKDPLPWWYGLDN